MSNTSDQLPFVVSYSCFGYLALLEDNYSLETVNGSNSIGPVERRSKDVFLLSLGNRKDLNRNVYVSVGFAHFFDTITC